MKHQTPEKLLTFRVLCKLFLRPPTLLALISKQTEQEVPTYHLPSCGALYALGAYIHFKETFPLTNVVVSCSLLLQVISLKVCNYQVIATENLLIIVNYFHIIESFANFAIYFPLEPFPASWRHHAAHPTHPTKQKPLQQSTNWDTLDFYFLGEILKVTAGFGKEIEHLSSFDAPGYSLHFLHWHPNTKCWETLAHLGSMSRRTGDNVQKSWC